MARRALSAAARTPTAAMADNARQALAWHDDGKPGGTRVGLNRARQIASRKPLSSDVIMRMHSFFARHEVDKASEHWDEPSPGKVAWYLWGGDEGKSWADRLASEMEG